MTPIERFTLGRWYWPTMVAIVMVGLVALANLILYSHPAL